MSRKSPEFDLLFAEGRSLTQWRREREKQIKTDKRLSESGRRDDLAELAREYGVKKNDLLRRYNEQDQKDRTAWQRIHDGNPPTKKSARERLRAKMSGGDFLDNYLDDDEKLNLWIESIESLQETITRASMRNTLATVDGERLQTLMHDAWEGGDIKQLELLRDVALVKGYGEGDKGGKLLAQSASAYIDDIKANNETPQQLQAKKEIERLDIWKTFFEHGIGLSERGGEFEDLRGREHENPLQLSTEQKIDREIERSKDPGFKNKTAELKGNGANEKI